MFHIAEYPLISYFNILSFKMYLVLYKQILPNDAILFGFKIQISFLFKMNKQSDCTTPTSLTINEVKKLKRLY